MQISFKNNTNIRQPHLKRYRL